MLSFNKMKKKSRRKIAYKRKYCFFPPPLLLLLMLADDVRVQVSHGSHARSETAVFRREDKWKRKNSFTTTAFISCSAPPSSSPLRKQRPYKEEKEKGNQPIVLCTVCLLC